MNILSIGNSFSQDAQRYIHNIAKSERVNLNTFNLFIGGCPLSRHYRNMLSDKPSYMLEMNGEATGFNTSIKEVLLNRDWDIVTFQQVSNQAPYYETYQPYLDKLVKYAKECAPKAKIVMHQTWAYEQGSKRLTEELGYKSYMDMFNAVQASYEKAAKSIAADFIIPSGELFCSLIASGIKKVHRDTFHASLGIGRYALGLLWYAFFTGNDITNNKFSDFDEDIDTEQIKLIKECVMRLYIKYRS